MAKEFVKRNVSKDEKPFKKAPTVKNQDHDKKRAPDSKPLNNLPAKKARKSEDPATNMETKEVLDSNIDTAKERNVALAALEAVALNASKESVEHLKKSDAIHPTSSGEDSSQKKEPLPKHLVKRQELLASSNWMALKKKIVKSTAGVSKRKVLRGGADVATKDTLSKGPGSLSSDDSATSIVAIDCEMVGVGPKGRRSSLARVCMVNNTGNVLLDLFCSPDEPVTDYRTWVSGVRPQDLRNAPPAWKVIDKVHALLKGRVVVGHALQNDFRALKLDNHPSHLIRDTAKYPKLLRKQANGKLVPQSLKELSAQYLGIEIQSGEHTPVDDARCALYVYHKFRKEWDDAVRKGTYDKMVEKEKQQALRDAGVLPLPKKSLKMNMGRDLEEAGNVGDYDEDSVGKKKDMAAEKAEIPIRRLLGFSAIPKPDAMAAGNKNIFTAVEEDERLRKQAMQRFKKGGGKGRPDWNGKKHSPGEGGGRRGAVTKGGGQPGRGVQKVKGGKKGGR